MPETRRKIGAAVGGEDGAGRHAVLAEVVHHLAHAVVRAHFFVFCKKNPKIVGAAFGDELPQDVHHHQTLRLHVGDAAPAEVAAVFDEVEEMVGAGHHFDVAVAEDVGTGGMFRFDEQRRQAAVVHFDEIGLFGIEEILDPGPRLFELLRVVANDGFKGNECL